MSNEYKFNVGKAIKLIQKLNSSVSYMACESLLHTHFKDLNTALDPKTIAECVVLLDGVWATQLFRASGDFDAIIKSLEKNAMAIKGVIKGLGENDLENDPDKIWKAAKKIFPKILKAKATQRENYSFTSKFFHWCSPTHFPIIDNRAREAINKLQRKHGWTRGHVPRVVTDDDYITDYRRWVQFYSGLIGSLSRQDRKKLVDADLASQPVHYRNRNTLLRVLDKAFYSSYGL